MSSSLLTIIYKLYKYIFVGYNKGYQKINNSRMGTLGRNLDHAMDNWLNSGHVLSIWILRSEAEGNRITTLSPSPDNMNRVHSERISYINCTPRALRVRNAFLWLNKKEKLVSTDPPLEPASTINLQYILHVKSHHLRKFHFRYRKCIEGEIANRSTMTNRMTRLKSGHRRIKLICMHVRIFVGPHHHYVYRVVRNSPTSEIFE